MSTSKPPRIPTRPDQSAQTGNQALTVHSQQFIGPLPPPEALRLYEETLPGAADRIIAMAEQQAAHRQRIESLAVQTQAKRSIQGLWLGAGLSFAMTMVAAALAFTGHQTAGIAFASINIAGVAGVFVYGSVSMRKEREDKAKISAGQGQ
ncbi:MAG: DUF2335 domain-containing protein [Armatimonadetes bacterium]|nr:DUF2335 domain-containing protein [Armatimonadota bacterium]